MGLKNSPLLRWVFKLWMKVNTVLINLDHVVSMRYDNDRELLVIVDRHKSAMRVHLTKDQYERWVEGNIDIFL